MGEVYLHIGTIKTGTTFLQKDVFPLIKNIKYYHTISLRTVLNISANNDIKTLISDECLSGFHIEKNKPDLRIKILNVLKILFPDAKIIITFREQNSFLKSAHNQAYKQRKFHKPLSEFKQVVDPSWYDWEYLKEHLKYLWNDVLVLDYDELCKNPNSYIKKICDFMGVSVPKFVNRKRNVSIPLPKEMNE